MVNNAAVAFKASKFGDKEAELTMKTNFYGAALVPGCVHCAAGFMCTWFMCIAVIYISYDIKTYVV